jgi:hypothetical protein
MTLQQSNLSMPQAGNTASLSATATNSRIQCLLFNLMKRVLASLSLLRSGARGGASSGLGLSLKRFGWSSFGCGPSLRFRARLSRRLRISAGRCLSQSNADCRML